MLELIVGHSLDPDAGYAAKELVEHGLRELNGRTPRAAILLSAVDIAHEILLAEIDRAFPGIALIGCTTDGELSSREGFQEGTTTLILFHSDDLEFGTGIGPSLASDPSAAAQAAVDQARSSLSSEPCLCIITPESLTASSSLILEGLRAELGTDFPIFGGLAGDEWRFDTTKQFFGKDVLVDALPVLLIAGPLLFSHGVGRGWRPLGDPSLVTEASGNVVARIGERSALEYYRHYLGENMLPSGECPLAVFEPDSSDHYLRAPLAFDAESGTITFAGDVPTGAKVQLTAASRDDIIAGSRASVEQATAAYPGERPTSAIIFSCAARKQLLGTRTNEEGVILRSALGADVPLAGFYAYGEFSPIAAGGEPRFHNETIITLLLGTH